MVLCEGGDLATVIEKRRMRFFTESEVASELFVVAVYGVSGLTEVTGHQLVDPDRACAPVYA